MAGGRGAPREPHGPGRHLNALSRKLLWLAAWVMGFAVAMACLLLGFKHRAAIDGLQRERLAIVAVDVEEIVERNLAFGLAFGEIGTLPDVLGTQKNADPLIQAIEILDLDGKVAYSSDAKRVGAVAAPEWLRAARAAESPKAQRAGWRARDGDDAVVGAVVHTAFGLALGHVVVRYKLDALDAASRAFAKRLAIYGLPIAAIGTLVLFLLLRLAQATLDRRLALARRLVADGGEAPAHAGIFAREAQQARTALADAEALLDAAEAALVPKNAHT